MGKLYIHKHIQPKKNHHLTKFTTYQGALAVINGTTTILGDLNVQTESAFHFAYHGSATFYAIL